MALEDTRPQVGVRLELRPIAPTPQMVAANAVARLFDEASYRHYPEPDLDTIRLSLRTEGPAGMRVQSVVATARCGRLVKEDGEPACPSCHAHGDQPHTEYCQLGPGEPFGYVNGRSVL